MARKEIIVTIPDGGNNLRFKIRQMSATQLESWLLRVGLLVAGSGVGIDANGGFSAIFDAFQSNPLKLIGALKYEDAKPLYDELLTCCSHIDGNAEIECSPEMLDGFISEVKTLFKLRWEVAKLNFGFFSAENKPESQSRTQSITLNSKM